jgi:hypothetical protein
MASRNELVTRGNAVGLTASNYPNDSKFQSKIEYLEQNGTTYTETLGVGTLTQSGPATTGDQITIGNRTYTYRTALTGVKATGLLTSTGVFADGETVTIEGKSYTFKTTLSSPAQQNEVLIGVSAAVSLDNLKLAINQGGTNFPTAVDNSGVGSTWSTGTVRHALVNATTNTNTTQVVEANQYGTAANQYSLGSTASVNLWGSTKMGTVVTTEVAGVANVPDEIKLTGSAATELDILKDAINAGAIVGVVGTDYSVGTYAHTQVTATTNGATTQVVAARNSAFDNAKIATTDPVDTGTVFSWGATTLASGVRGVAAVDTGSSTGSAGLSGAVNHV